MVLTKWIWDPKLRVTNIKSTNLESLKEARRAKVQTVSFIPLVSGLLHTFL